MIKPGFPISSLSPIDCRISSHAHLFVLYRHTNTHQRNLNSKSNLKRSVPLTAHLYRANPGRATSLPQVIHPQASSDAAAAADSWTASGGVPGPGGGTAAGALPAFAPLPPGAVGLDALRQAAPSCSQAATCQVVDEACSGRDASPAPSALTHAMGSLRFPSST